VEFIASAMLYAPSDALCKLAARTGIGWLCAIADRLPCPPTTDPRCRGKCASSRRG
jgi:hypothetical protein